MAFNNNPESSYFMVQRLRNLSSEVCMEAALGRTTTSSRSRSRSLSSLSLSLSVRSSGRGALAALFLQVDMGGYTFLTAPLDTFSTHTKNLCS